MINAIVLDVGGVILRTEDRSGRLKLEEKYHLPPGGVDNLVFNSQTAADSTIGKAEPEQIWQNVAEQLSLSPQALMEFQQLFWQGDQIDQGLIQFLIEQKAAYKTALLTNAWLDARTALAQQFGIIEGQTVDHILISSELGIAKPEKRIYHILAQTIHSDFGQILFVDDFIENIDAAEALGIQTILYQPGMDLIAHIQAKLQQD